MQSEHISELAAALAKAQRTLKAAVKDSTNPHFRSRYADLASVWSAWQEAGPAHGLAITQTTAVRDGGIVLITQISHSSGQWMRGEYPLNPIKNDPQGLGSVLTYARRYSLAAITGVCPDDDDSEGAMGREGKQPLKVETLPAAAEKIRVWVDLSLKQLSVMQSKSDCATWAGANAPKLEFLAQNHADLYDLIETAMMKAGDLK